MDSVDGRGDYERQVALGSEIATLAVGGLLLVVALLPPTRNEEHRVLVLTAAVLFLFTALWFHVLPRSLFGTWRVGIGTTLVLLIVGALLVLTGGSGSAYFPYFLVPLLSTAFITPRATLLVGTIAAVIGLALVAWELRTDAGERELARGIAQLFAIAAVTIVSWLIAASSRRTRLVLRQHSTQLGEQNRELEIARATALSLARARERAQLVRGIFESSRGPLGADLALLFVSAGSGFQDGLAVDALGHLEPFQTDALLTRSPGRVAMTERRTVVVHDVDAERTELSPALRDRLRVKAGIFMPLVVRDESFGLIIFAQRTPRAWTPQDVRIAEVIAEAATAAVASFASYDQVRAQAEVLAERSRVLEGINQLVDVLAITPDEHATSVATARSMQQTFRLRAATTLLIDPSLALLETSGATDGARPHPVVTDPQSCPAVHSGRLFVVRGADDVAVCSYMPAGGGPYACIPLAGAGTPLGALFLEPDERSVVDESFMRAASDRAGLTIATRRLLATARRQATTDGLTGLFNRRFMEEQLRLAQSLAERHGEPYSIVAFDVDELKVLNDTLGHEAGDQGLRSFARSLSRVIRASDIAVRTGGDEFAILASRTRLDEAVLLAERVREAAHPAGQPQVQGAMTASAGVAAWRAGRSIEDVLRLADAMLYKAKRAGRDRVVAEPGDTPR